MGKSLVEDAEHRREVTSWERAKAIMGNRAIGIDGAHSLGLAVHPMYTASRYGVVPFSEAELVEAHESKKIVVDMPDMDLLTLIQSANQFKWQNQWYLENQLIPNQITQWFVYQKARRGYHLMYPELPDSDRYLDRPQVTKQPEGFETPYVVEVAYTVAAWEAAHNYNTQGGSFVGAFMRCRDIDSDGEQLVFTEGFRNPPDFFIGVPHSLRESVGLASGQYRPLLF